MRRTVWGCHLPLLVSGVLQQDLEEDVGAIALERVREHCHHLVACLVTSQPMSRPDIAQQRQKRRRGCNLRLEGMRSDRIDLGRLIQEEELRVVTESVQNLLQRLGAQVLAMLFFRLPDCLEKLRGLGSRQLR